MYQDEGNTVFLYENEGSPVGKLGLSLCMRINVVHQVYLDYTCVCQGW